MGPIIFRLVAPTSPWGINKGQGTLAKWSPV